MKIRAQCVPCLLTRGFFECKEYLGDSQREKEVKAIRDATNVLNKNFDPAVCSATIATKMHRAIYQALETDDPYVDIKKRSNKAAMELIPKAKDFIAESEDKLKAAMLISIVGNLLDFGIKGVIDDPESLNTVFDEILEHGLDLDDVDKVRPLVGPGANIVYLPDNAGEIVFDRLTIEVLKELGARVVVMVKGKPILTDATVEDAKEAGIYEVADEVITTGSDAIGLSLDELPQQSKCELFKADLIIAKGMANYEAMSEPEYRNAPPILFVLRTKCEPVAEDIGVQKDMNVAFFSD